MMKLQMVILSLMLGSCAAPQPYAERQGPPEELVGRSAGAPQRCVSTSQTDSLRVSANNRHTLVYGNNRTIWANNLGGQCSFDYNDVLVTEPVGSYYCRGDLVRSFDRYSRIPGPACVLSDFVPYSR
jgi:hypothetical protein